MTKSAISFSKNSMPKSEMVMPVTNDLRSEILRLASSLGFSACRIARCDPPRHADEFRAWLRDGAAGDMHWMERSEEKRSDPQLVLPGARSVIVLALNYWQGAEESRGKGESRVMPGATTITI